MMTSLASKELVRQVFTFRELLRLPFIPWVCSHAARLEQISVRKMLTDPAQLAKALQNAQKLYGYDAVVNIFDPTLEAEACGCPITWEGEYEIPTVSHPAGHYEEIAQLDISDIEKRGRLPVALESMRRLKIVLGRTVAIVGVITGPLSLASYLTGTNTIQALEEKPEEAKKVIDFAGRVITKVCRAYCELEPDIITLADDLLPQLPAKHFPIVLSVLRPVLNIVPFYNAKLVLLLKECSLEKMEDLFSFKADALAINTGANLVELKKETLRHNSVLGGAIPSSLLGGPGKNLREHVHMCLEKGGKSGFFLSTDWDIPIDMPPENMHEIIKIVKPW